MTPELRAELETALARALASQTHLSVAQGRWIIKTSSGITLYRGAQRPGALRAIRRHADKVHRAFSEVSENKVHRAFSEVSESSKDVIKKVGQVAAMITELPAA